MVEKFPKFERNANGAISLVVAHTGDNGETSTMRYWLSEKNAARLFDELTTLEPKHKPEQKNETK